MPARITSSQLQALDLPVWQHLKALYDQHVTNRSGELASYIPELAAVNPDQFGIAVATTDGFVYDVGDATAPFTVQSISKAVVYGLALEDHGAEAVLRRIGVEPSGDAFNSIAFDERYNRPFNPMVNAGAIAATALVKGATRGERFARIVERFQRLTGRVPRLDDAVYRSESLTGHRNRAIAYLELNAGMIDGPIDDHLDLYFRQCSLLVTARDLAVMGATLASGGFNPVSGEQALDAEHVRSLLSVMNTCGMYDYAGGWQFNVGMPAKSGVGGGIMAVLPGHLGIGVFSPRLDAVGNSERGVKVCADLSRSFGLHLFEDRHGDVAPFRRIYRGSEVRSRRARRLEDVRRLDRLSHHVVVYELHAEIGFIEAERVTRRIVKDLDYASHVIVDLTRVMQMDAIAGDVLDRLLRTLSGQEHGLAVVSLSTAIRRRFEHHRVFLDIDSAIEHFENQLIGARAGSAQPCDVPLDRFDLLNGLSAAVIAALDAGTRRRPFARGDRLITQNDEAGELFFLTRGRVDVVVSADAGQPHRVSTIEAGNVFGELALFGHAPRTADVVAATDGEVRILDEAGMADLRKQQPDVFTDLLIAVGGSLADRLRHANEEISALSR